MSSNTMGVSQPEPAANKAQADNGTAAAAASRQEIPPPEPQASAKADEEPPKKKKTNRPCPRCGNYHSKECRMPKCPSCKEYHWPGKDCIANDPRLEVWRQVIPRLKPESVPAIAALMNESLTEISKSYNKRKR
jgi:hypothetical protein